MSESFEVRVDQWLSSEHGNAMERATLADIGIHVDGHCATEVEDVLAKSIRKTARLSAFHLAQWFAANWWRLRWEPEASTLAWKMSHTMGAVGGGFVWPNLSFSSDGSTVLVRSRSTRHRSTEPIRYLSDFEYFIPACEFEHEIDEFVETVIARLVSGRINDSQLASLWSEVCEERKDDEKAGWRKLEAIMGFDPDEAPEELMEALKARAKSQGASAVEEIAAASKTEAISHIQMLLEDVRKISTPIDVSDVEILRKRVGKEIDHAWFPWQRADRAAEITRETWKLEKGPITTDTLSNLFQITKKVLQEPEDSIGSPMAAGFRNDYSRKISVFLEKKHPSSRRFMLARLVGDCLNSDMSEKLLPATEKKTERQKFQRAFAQEFLCPFQDLKEYIGSESPTDDQIDDAANYFDVSPLLVKTTLVNKGVLGRDTLGAYTST